ncbi:hypothetical protein B0H10DRAFT_1993512 [Mycena sp. CBHHK59/15]|nr:hypothetical protein B0H10DRAFT_1993512 [Mycena sp. CBHHK59/15]
MRRKTNSSSSAQSLPPELWLYVHRLATSYRSPLDLAYSSRDRYGASEDPFNGTRSFFQDVCSFVRVCKLWNELAQELLYENVKVNNRFAMLSAVLERPETARLVRSIRLSPTRFDHNFAILKRCPLVEALVLPEFPRPDKVAFTTDSQLSPLLSLKCIYWKESSWSSALLQSVFKVAQNLEHLRLSSSSTIGSDRDIPLVQPAFGLQSLVIAQLSPPWVQSVLRTDLHHLTRLIANPEHLSADTLPELPYLHTLEVSGRSRLISIPFPDIFLRCPNLRDLCYDVGHSIVLPEKTVRSTVSCVRLHISDANVPEWTLFDVHFNFLLSPAFVELNRLVLHGTFQSYFVGKHDLHDQFYARGCRIEFDDGTTM